MNAVDYRHKPLSCGLTVYSNFRRVLPPVIAGLGLFIWAIYIYDKRYKSLFFGPNIFPLLHMNMRCESQRGLLSSGKRSYNDK